MIFENLAEAGFEGRLLLFKPLDIPEGFLVAVFGFAHDIACSLAGLFEDQVGLFLSVGLYVLRRLLREHQGFGEQSLLVLQPIQLSSAFIALGLHLLKLGAQGFDFVRGLVQESIDRTGFIAFADGGELGVFKIDWIEAFHLT